MLERNIFTNRKTSINNLLLNNTHSNNIINSNKLLLNINNIRKTLLIQSKHFKWTRKTILQVKKVRSSETFLKSKKFFLETFLQVVKVISKEIFTCKNA